MAYFPLFIDLEERPCLVIGAGKVALRKINTLLKYHPALTVASTDFLPEVKALASRVSLVSLPEEADLNEELTMLYEYMNVARLVVAASGNHELNTAVGHYCRAKGIPVNVIDAPKLCSFVFPSVVVRGDISVGINTGTKSPALSKQIRKQVEKAIPEIYEEIAIWLAGLRDFVKDTYEKEDQRRYILKSAAAKAFELDRVLTEEELEDILERAGEDFA